MSTSDPAVACRPIRATPADGHQWRSELLDGFAQLEAAAVAKSRELGALLGAKVTLAQRLSALKKLDLHQPDEARARLDACLALVEVRNDLVHAKLQMVMLPADDGGPTFLFRNVGLPHDDGTALCRMVNESGFKSLQIRVKQCREYIRLLRAPAPDARAAAIARA